jgi:hypothetical protein
MALDASDMEWLNGKFRAEIEPLQQRLAEQGALVDELLDLVWALNVQATVFQKLVPAEQAWAAAESIETNIECAPAEQRASETARRLELFRDQLRQRAVVPRQPS